MLPKKKRLTKEDFKKTRLQVFFRGNVLDVARGPSQEQKFACVISKKKIATAVGRNTVKRKVYHALKQVPSHLQGIFIIYPKSIPKNTPFSAISDEIIRAFATLQ